MNGIATPPTIPQESERLGLENIFCLASLPWEGDALIGAMEEIRLIAARKLGYDVERLFAPRPLQVPRQVPKEPIRVACFPWEG